MNHQDFLRIPFVDGGRDYQGADCWGLVRLFYRDVLSIDLRSFAEYRASDVRSVAHMMEIHRQEWQKVDPPAVHDVALMRCHGREGSTLVAHVGIVLDRGRVLHTEVNGGVKNERLDALHIKSRILEFRRHRLCKT